MTTSRESAPSRARLATKTRTIMWYAGTATLAMVVLYPVLWLVGSAFKPGDDILGNPAILTPEPTLEHFRRVFQGIGGVSFWQFLGNSLFLASASVVGVVASSAFTAYAFARIRFTGRKVFFALMIGTLLLPFHVVIIPQYVLFLHLGVLDTFVPLLVGKFLGCEAFFVFLFVQFIRSIPDELDEAARIDGCGHYRIFFHIIMPLLKPAVVTASIFVFVWTWNDFLAPLLFLRSAERYPLPLALQTYVEATSTQNYGAVMAMSLLSLVPVLLFFLFFQRHLVQGVATQGLKG